ncbi:MAG: hypothetical protein AAGF23_00165 [Acidobacteriota bacterium]
MTEIDHLYTVLRPSLPKRVGAEHFRDALADLESALSAVPGPRCQLRLRRLRFWGEKKGDFRFFPGVNVLRAGNDKGKSSILKMIHFCLTGKNDLKKDVDSWIKHVELYFELDGQPHAVEVHKVNRPRGRIVACRGDRPEDLDRAEVLVEFRNGKAMQQELERFFMQRFGLRTLRGTQKDSRKGSDRLLDAPTSYRAYVRGLYVTQDYGYTDLVTDGVPYGNLFMKVVGMLLGLRGLDGIFAIEARLAHVENLLGKEERYHRRLEASLSNTLGARDLASLDAEIKQLEQYVDERKLERTGLLVRATSNDLDQRLADLTDRLVALENTRQLTSRALEEAEGNLERTGAEVADFEGAVSSKAWLATVAPVHWPGTEIELTADQRRQLEAEMAASREQLDAVAEKRLASARSSLDAQRRSVERRRGELQELQFRIDQVIQQRRHLQSQLRSAHQSTAELEHEIELETRYLGRLEAEREAAARIFAGGDEKGGVEIRRLLREKYILQAVLRQLRLQDAASNEERKQEFARRVQDYCTTIGFPSLEDITLDANLKPRISQNGKTYAFDELSPGEKVRFVLAFYLGLAIVTAEDLPNGAHPGLLLIDSPGKEEMVQGDFQAVVKLLSQIEGQHSESIQAIVATSIPEIRGATQISKQFFIDEDDEPVFA